MRAIVRSLCALVAVGVVAALVLPALAAETKGKIKSVTPALKKIVVTDANGKDWTMEIHRTAKIKLGGQTAKLDDLKRGDEVTINYDKEGEKLIVKEIDRK